MDELHHPQLHIHKLSDSQTLTKTLTLFSSIVLLNVKLFNFGS